MTVRGANYPRKENDFYATPPETTRVLLDHVAGFGEQICDPACGNGAIVKVLKEYHCDADGSDLAHNYNFLADDFLWPGWDIITNPPFGPGGRTAVAFIERALEVTRPRGKVAMLLPVDFDSGITRRHLFECRAFALKLTLLNRVRWFNGVSGSLNHAWFVFDHKNRGLPRIKYAAQVFPPQ
jgi:hypothetical protein